MMSCCQVLGVLRLASEHLDPKRGTGVAGIPAVWKAQGQRPRVNLAGGVNVSGNPPRVPMKKTPVCSTDTPSDRTGRWFGVHSSSLALEWKDSVNLLDASLKIKL